MKKLFVAGVLLIATACTHKLEAQVNVSVNIGTQPAWGPTGYDHVDYYYIPDIQCYYYVPSHQFVYLNGNRWTFSNTLPHQYRDFDLFHSYKVVMNEPQPYLHYDQDRDKYGHYKGNANGQMFIRNSNEDRYRDHWHDQHEADEEWRHKGDDRRQNH
jgi:hypothetical protein